MRALCSFVWNTCCSSFVFHKDISNILSRVAKGILWSLKRIFCLGTSLFNRSKFFVINFVCRSTHSFSISHNSTKFLLRHTAVNSDSFWTLLLTKYFVEFHQEINFYWILSEQRSYWRLDLWHICSHPENFRNWLR